MKIGHPLLLSGGKKRKKVWQTREIRPPQEVNEVWQTNKGG
jgi:hypothetical protein